MGEGPTRYGLTNRHEGDLATIHQDLAVAVGLFCLQVFPSGISDALDGDQSTEWAYVDGLGPLLFIVALT